MNDPSAGRSATKFLGIAITVVLIAGVVSTNPVLATPSFARKYQTSCQTCHVAYPKLNNFGIAFRLNGYHLPAETEAQIKSPDVSLGAEGYKRVWPKAIWPGAIPVHVPLSLVTEFQVVSTSAVEHVDGEMQTEKTHNDFVFPSAIELVAAGSAGDHVSFFGELDFEQEPEDGKIESNVEIGHIDVRFIRPIKNSLAFNFKIGSWQPELVATFDHARRLTVANYDSMFGVNTVNPGGAESVGGGGHHGGGGGIALPAVARGIDMYGVVVHRFFWAAGLMNGVEAGSNTFDANSSKDFYGRVAYKWGGMALDGANAADYTQSDKNWQEKSFQLGLLYYNGDANLEEPQPILEDGMVAHFVDGGSFERVGVDFIWWFKDLNVFGAYVRGEDDISTFEVDLTDPLVPVPGPLDDAESGTFKYDSWFIEADVVLGYPWLLGAFRYETVDFSKIEDGTPVKDFERATIHFTGLIRANVKAFAEYTWDLNQSKNNTIWLGLGIAF